MIKFEIKNMDFGDEIRKKCIPYTFFLLEKGALLWT